MVRRIVFVLIILFVSVVSAYAQNGYKGKDFWLAFPQNAASENEYSLEQSVYIVGPEGTQGVVKEGLTGKEHPFTLNALGFFKCPVDTANILTAEGKYNAGIHIVTTEDVQVTAVSHRKASTDSYAGIPVDKLGNDYVLIGYDPVSAGTLSFATQADIIATENDTKVTIRYPAAIVFDTTPRVEVLKRGEVLHLGGKVTPITADLTGTIIHADKPVAVLTGHSCSQIPVGTSFCDMLIEMLPPTTALGSQYVVAHLNERERTTIRVLAFQDQTEVSVDGKKRILLNKGEYYEDGQLKNNAFVTTSKPAYVMQYGHSAEDDANKIADPFMMVVAPTSGFITDIDIITPTFAKTQDEIEFEKMFTPPDPNKPIVSSDSSHIYYPNKSMTVTPPPGVQQDMSANQSGWVHWLNVVTEQPGTSTFVIDDQPIDKNLFQQVWTSRYYVAHVKVEPGRHKLHSTFPFAAYLYGYGKGGANYDSYGHLCGMK